MPVKLDELQAAADATGGKAYVAPSADELAKAYEDIRANLQQTTGEAVTTIHELTWRYAAGRDRVDDGRLGPRPVVAARPADLAPPSECCRQPGSTTLGRHVLSVIGGCAAAASVMRWARASAARLAAILFIT